MLKYLRQLASESLIYGLSGTVIRFITIFLVPLYTRVLTPSDYGVMSLVRNSTSLVAMFASLALDTAAHRFYWDSEDTADRKSTLASWACSWLLLLTLAAIFIIIFANSLATRIIGSVDAVQPLRLAASTLPLGALGVLYMNRLRMERRPWAFSIFALVSSVISVVSAALFVLVLRRGVEGVFLSQLVASLLTSTFVLTVLLEWVHPRYFDWERFKKMLRYAIPMLPAVVAFWVVDVIDRYFLRAYASTSEVGLYEIGYSLAAVVALGTTAFQQAWIPFAMSIQKVPDARKIYSNTLLAYTWIGCFMCAGASLFAPEALQLLTTKSYYSASSVVPFLAFSYFFMGVAYIVSVGATIKKQSSSFGAAFVTAAVMNIALNFWLVPRYGRDGAAIATLLSYAVVPLYLYYRSQQVYEIPYRFGRSLAILILAVVVIRLGAVCSVDSFVPNVLIKSGLLSLFLPLLFVLGIVNLGHVRAVVDRSLTYGFKIQAFVRR